MSDSSTDPRDEARRAFTSLLSELRLLNQRLADMDKALARATEATEAITHNQQALAEVAFLLCDHLDSLRTGKAPRRKAPAPTKDGFEILGDFMRGLLRQR